MANQSDDFSRSESVQSTRIDRRQFLQTASLAGGALGLSRTPGAAPATSPSPREAEEAVYLSDMSLCQPSAALARLPEPKHWRLIDYETDTFKGVMIQAGVNTDAPEITFPVSHRGWHRIYIGIYTYGAEGIFQNIKDEPEDVMRVQVRLTSDSTFTVFTQKLDQHARDVPADIGSGPSTDDFFWKCADLTGQEVVIRQCSLQVFPETPASSGRLCNNCWIAYIKLVPMSDEQVQSLTRDREQKSNRRLYAHNDAHDYLYYYHPHTEAEIRREIECYRNTDFGRIYWEGAMGDICNYYSKIGLWAGHPWIKDTEMLGYRMVMESWAAFREQGIDPFRVALKHAHDIGLEFHAAMRTGGFHSPVPWDQWNAGGLYERHPEWRAVDRQGRTVPRLSYAYPEVPRFIVSLLKEMSGFGVDGVCLLYNRRLPLVEYEAPIVEGFKEKYGQDPRSLEEMDSRWLAYRSTVLTQFMRLVRHGMVEAAREQGRSKPIEITAVVMSSRKEHLYYAIDLETWVKEGLVDTIIPYASMGNASITPEQARYFVNLTQGGPCKLAVNIMPRQLSAAAYRNYAHALYSVGVENLFFWDANQRVNLGASWTELQRLGHREDIARWVEAGSPKIEWQGSKVAKLGDWDVRYSGPG